MDMKQKFHRDTITAKQSVFAYYHPFFGTPNGPSGEYRAWSHPTRLGKTPPGDPLVEELDDRLSSYFQPDPSICIGANRPNTFSPQIPKLGLYDTQDKETLRKHAELAIQAGLNGFAWDFVCDTGDEFPIGQAHAVASFEKMLQVLHNHDMPLKLTILYDGYCWVGSPVENIVKHLTYIRDKYYGNPNMAYIDEKLPVLVFATLMKHTMDDWREVRERLDESGVKQLKLVAGELAGTGLDEANIFDGVSRYSSNVKNLTEQGLRDTFAPLANFAQENGLFLALPIVPGFDDRIWLRPGVHAPRHGGETYKMGWKICSEFNPDWYMICSWNEWGEGTQIEPDCDFGFQYLELTREMISRYVHK